jgi:hypothetical protein
MRNIREMQEMRRRAFLLPKRQEERFQRCLDSRLLRDPLNLMEILQLVQLVKPIPLHNAIDGCLPTSIFPEAHREMEDLLCPSQCK